MTGNRGSAPGATTAPGRCRSSPGRSGSERVHFEAPAAGRVDREMAALPRLVQRGRRRHLDPGAQGGAGASLVRDHPSVRRRQRPDRARRSPTWSLARSEQSPQRFYSMSAQIRRGAERLLRHPRTDPEGDAGRHALDGMVPRLSRTAPSTGHEDDPGGRPRARPGSGRRMPDVTLNDRQRLVLNRLLDGFEGKLTTSKWAKLAKMFAGHGAARHPRPGRAGRAGPQSWRRPEHELLAGGESIARGPRGMEVCFRSPAFRGRGPAMPVRCRDGDWRHHPMTLFNRLACVCALTVLVGVPVSAQQHPAMPSGMTHEQHMAQMNMRGAKAMGFDQSEGDPSLHADAGRWTDCDRGERSEGCDHARRDPRAPQGDHQRVRGRQTSRSPRRSTSSSRPARRRCSG